MTNHPNRISEAAKAFDYQAGFAAYHAIFRGRADELHKTVIKMAVDAARLIEPETILLRQIAEIEAADVNQPDRWWAIPGEAREGFIHCQSQELGRLQASIDGRGGDEGDRPGEADALAALLLALELKIPEKTACARVQSAAWAAAGDDTPDGRKIAKAVRDCFVDELRERVVGAYHLCVSSIQKATGDYEALLRFSLDAEAMLQRV